LPNTLVSIFTNILFEKKLESHKVIIDRAPK